MTKTDPSQCDVPIRCIPENQLCLDAMEVQHENCADEWAAEIEEPQPEQQQLIHVPVDTSGDIYGMVTFIGISLAIFGVTMLLLGALHVIKEILRKR